MTRRPAGLASGRFLLGANLPWIAYGCDVGACAWHPGGGLADAGRDTFERDLLDLAAGGFEVVRWFALCDGRSGVRFAVNGVPLGLDDRALPDFDAAVTVADRVGIALWPVLIDFHWCRPARHINGVRLGGHAGTLIDPARRNALLDRVFRPLATRFGRATAIWAWDIVNEPEWVTLGLGAWNPFGAIEQPDMRVFIRSTRELLHAETVHPVTVGSASAAWLPLVSDLGLDFYSPHWYDRLERLAPLATPVSAFGADRPVVLGEFPTRGSAHETDSLVAIAERSGYAGAFLWSARANDRASDFQSGRARLRGVGGTASGAGHAHDRVTRSGTNRSWSGETPRGRLERPPPRVARASAVTAPPHVE